MTISRKGALRGKRSLIIGLGMWVSQREIEWLIHRGYVAGDVRSLVSEGISVTEKGELAMSCFIRGESWMEA